METLVSDVKGDSHLWRHWFLMSREIAICGDIGF